MADLGLTDGGRATGGSGGFGPPVWRRFSGPSTGKSLINRPCRNVVLKAVLTRFSNITHSKSFYVDKIIGYLIYIKSL